MTGCIFIYVFLFCGSDKSPNACWKEKLWCRPIKYQGEYLLYLRCVNNYMLFVTKPNNLFNSKYLFPCSSAFFHVIYPIFRRKPMLFIIILFVYIVNSTNGAFHSRIYSQRHLRPVICNAIYDRWKTSLTSAVRSFTHGCTRPVIHFPRWVSRNWTHKEKEAPSVIVKFCVITSKVSPSQLFVVWPVEVVSNVSLV